MTLLSVNVGQPRLNPWKEMRLTGIDKRPVDGPVMVMPARAKGLGMVGLAGDPVEVVLRPEHDVTVAICFRALTLSPKMLPRLLAAQALPRDLRDLARRRTA
ncbi:MAG: hypothetical protein ACRDNT_16590 [Streptosporangiaceae bacterium]